MNETLLYMGYYSVESELPDKVYVMLTHGTQWDD